MMKSYIRCMQIRCVRETRFSAIWKMVVMMSLCMRETWLSTVWRTIEMMSSCVWETQVLVIWEMSQKLSWEFFVWMTSCLKELKMILRDAVMMWMTFHMSEFGFAVKMTAKGERLLWESLHQELKMKIHERLNSKMSLSVVICVQTVDVVFHSSL